VSILRTEESVVLCGPDGSAVGRMAKKDVHHRETPLHLAFSCYVFDQDSRLLITRRALSKKTWPGVRTNSCCGHPAPAESMRDAIRRRLDEELGLSVEDIVLRLPGFRYRAVMVDGMVENELCPVFSATVRTPVELITDPSEVEDAEWCPWREYSATALTDPASISPWSALQVVELVALGEDHRDWPVASDSALPAAAVA
jgi:isopentenyl-diphosphate delta-isomerase